MRRWIATLFCLSLVVTAVPSLALNPGDDVLVPAAAKSDPWVTDLYVMNPGADDVSGTVYWLVRNQANPNPTGIPFTLEPGETMVMADAIGDDFGMASGAGAFRVVADGEVVVNSRIYSQGDNETFGQGFEGVPASAATAVGQTASVVGLTQGSGFRTNFYALAGASGATMTIALYDPAGDMIASDDRTLRAYEPYLRTIGDTIGSGDFADGTLQVSVSAGSAVVGASKVDNASGDPTTLEGSVPLGSGGGSADGTYQISLYDSETFAAGGNLVISGGQVTAINGTFMNWDKDEDADGSPDCVLIFLWGLGLTPTDVGDFADGVDFSDSYASTGSGDMAWTVDFTMDDTMSLNGSVSAVGSNFPSSTDPNEDQSGCNGTFDALTLEGGKTN